MQAVPMPEVLDAERLLVEPNSAEQVGDVLRRTCEYGQLLWRELQAVREYLLENTQDGRAAPTGPDDEDGWTRWRMLYTDVTGMLAGPRGDTGFARIEAQHEMRRRRGAGQPGEAAEKGGVEG